MRDNKTKLITGSVVALGVIVVLGLVYAAFTQQLNINGSATGRSSSWKIYFSRLTGPVLNGTAKQITAPEIKNNSTTIGDYSVTVTSPGDYIEYEFDVTNDGDYDATLTGLTKNSNTELTYEGSGDNEVNDENNVKSQIEYTLKYADGTNVAENDTLKSKETKTMRLRLTYKTFSDASLLPKADVAISGLGISLTYTQDGNAKVNDDGTTPYVKQYVVGDTFTLNGDSYHVIANSETASDYVVALKDTPLTASEINTYGSGHVNMYQQTSSSYYQQAYEYRGVGGMAYYNTETCGYNGSDMVTSGCSTSYESSDVKRVVDGWAQAKFTNSELKTVDGYAARLINLDKENMESLGYEWGNPTPSDMGWVMTSSVPSWFYSPNCMYWYWTMSQYNDSSESVWNVYCVGVVGGNYASGNVRDYVGAVRPVINVYKSAITQ